MGEKSCPKSFRCVKKDSCPNYRVAKLDIYWTTSRDLSAAKWRFIQDLVCDEEGDSVCCPRDNQDDLLSSRNILQSYRAPR